MCQRLQVPINMAKRVIVLLLVFSLPENYYANNDSNPAGTPTNQNVKQAHNWRHIIMPTEDPDDTAITTDFSPEDQGINKVFTSNVYAFQLGGSWVAIVAAATIATCVIFFGKKRKATLNQNGCENPAFEEDSPTSKTPGQLDNCPPIYDYDYAYTKNHASDVSPAIIVPSRNAQQLPRQHRVSTCSDYTEPHYYTEIDEHFVKKINLSRQQNKARCENKPRQNQDPPMKNSSHTNSPPPEYDYAYVKKP